MRHLFIGNPMLGELRREKNKALSIQNWQGGQLAARVLLVIIYLFILLLTLNYVEYVEPFVLLYVLLALATFLLPASLHGVIAGEREKRSLDMLLCAPVTAGQIVVGKFSRAVLTIGGLTVAIGVPALIIEIVKELNVVPSSGAPARTVGGFFLALLVCLSASFFISATTVWVSSKMKTSSSAMLATVAVMFVTFVVTWAVGAVVSTLSDSLSRLLIYLNPYAALYYAYTGDAISSYDFGSYSETSSKPFVWISIVLCCGVALLMLLFASRNVYELSRGRKE